MFHNTLLIYSSFPDACDEEKMIHIWQIDPRLKQRICIELSNWGYIEHLQLSNM